MLRKSMSQLVSDLKMDTGLAFISLPFDDFENRIIDLIQTRTIPTFSIYQPFRTEVFIDLKELQCIKDEYTMSTYILPKVNGKDILYVEDVTLDKRIIGGSYYDPVGDLCLHSYGELMLAQAHANLISISAPTLHFQFEEPNKLHLYNISSMGDKLKLRVCLEHSDNLSSITKTSWNSFYKLALLDFQCFLYNSLKYFDGIESAHGTINLRTSEWESAFDKREDLLARWDDTYHLDGQQEYYL